MGDNIAKQIILPGPRVFRIVFLYVGQGESTLLLVPEGDNHKFVLVDSHEDSSAGGIDSIRLLRDLFDGDGRGLDVFVNTHPHKDHVGKVKEIYDKIGIKQIWHSGHKPGKEHLDAYKDLEYVMKKIGDENVFRLFGSREENKLDDKAVKLGDINYNVLAPAEYVSDDIEDEDPEARYRRIHEQCGVIRFKYGRQEKQILITGDADRAAWERHITTYHRERLPSTVLSAVHHGSNTFFWEDSNAEGDPYEEHLAAIDPTYVIVSAPKRSESKHNHPHKEAMEKYEAKVTRENVKHLGANRECVIVDITAEGDFDLYPDDDLVKEYGVDKDETDDEKRAPAVITRVDRKPMGA